MCCILDGRFSRANRAISIFSGDSCEADGTQYVYYIKLTYLVILLWLKSSAPNTRNKME